MKTLFATLLLLVSVGAAANTEQFNATQCVAYFDFKQAYYYDAILGMESFILPEQRVKDEASAEAAHAALARATEHAKSLGASDDDIKETTKSLSMFFTPQAFEEYEYIADVTTASMVIVVFERDCKRYYEVQKLKT